MKKISDPSRGNKTAQSIIELAVFGAVLFFLIGGIASNYMGASMQQNAQLQAMRIALFNSHNGGPARGSSSYLFYEDRLTGEAGKYNVDRAPVIAMGNGMFSDQMMYTLDWPVNGVADIEQKNINVMDLVINGRRFVLRMAGFVQYEILKQNGYSVSAATLEQMSVPGVSELIIARIGPNPGDGGIRTALDHCRSDVASSGWVTDTSSRSIPYSCESDETIRKRLAFEWSKYGATSLNLHTACQTTAATTVDNKGFPPFYAPIVGNDDEFDAYGDNKCAYDYARKGFDANTPQLLGNQYGWYWVWTWADIEKVADEIDNDNGNFPSYDIDGDLTQETVYEITPNATLTSPPSYLSNYKYYRVKVLDTNAGEVDFSEDPTTISDPTQRQGLRQDMRIYSRTECVESSASCTGDRTTYFDVKEGKTYSLSGDQPLSITTTKKNTFDLVERVYKLNPRMIDPAGFFCQNGEPNAALGAVASGTGISQCYCLGPTNTVCPTATGGIEVMCTGGTTSWPGGTQWIGTNAGCCASSANIFKTCFNLDTKTLYIRSRIYDKRGHRWITDTEQDLEESLGLR